MPAVAALAALGRADAACAAEGAAGDAGRDGGDAASQPSSPGDPRDIVVFGRHDDGSLAGIAAGDELGEDDIAAHGLNTVAELLEELSASLGGRGGSPVFLINGEPVSGLEDVADLPTEALRKIQLLPRGMAARFAPSAGSRVLNIVVRSDFRQLALRGEAGRASAGGGDRALGEATFTRAGRGARTNIALKVQGSAMLRENERGIITDTAGAVPWDRAGNVVPAGGFGLEIDPALSALAGFPVDVAAVPANAARPALADFRAGAGQPRSSDLGAFHSLLPRTRSYALNATFFRKLSPRTSLTAYARGELLRSEALNGLPTALLAVPAGSAFSPFTRAVGVARYLEGPLEQTVRGGNASLGATINTAAGGWRLSLVTAYSHRESRTLSDRGLDLSALQQAIALGTVNPFGAVPGSYLSARLTDPARSRADRASFTLTASREVARLPAGPLMATLRSGAVIDRFSSRSTTGATTRDIRRARDEGSWQLALDLPLAAGGARGGSLSARLSGTLRRVSLAGTLHDAEAALEWQPLAGLTIEGGYDRAQVAPGVQVLSDPVVLRAGVRLFDFLTQQTVTVTTLTGGNPALPPETRGTWRLGATWRALPGERLVLTGEYARMRRRDAQAALPPLSAAVQAAFAERFQRDAAGFLGLVDMRAVSFARADHDELRWGLSLRHHFRATAPGSEAAGEEFPDESDSAPAGAARSALRRGVGGWRLNASLHHTWTLRSVRLARAGLPVIDLLNGGAAGYGGGMPRHGLDATLGLAGHGVGFQARARWQSANWIKAGAADAPSDLRFAPRAAIDLRLFADLGRVLPASGWARGLRLSLAAENLLDSQQTVRSRAGVTPLGYQPYLLDPLGRTISFSLRKTF